MTKKPNFDMLPKFIQDKIRDFLLANNFPAAKALYEQWLAQKAH